MKVTSMVELNVVYRDIAKIHEKRVWERRLRVTSGYEHEIVLTIELVRVVTGINPSCFLCPLGESYNRFLRIFNGVSDWRSSKNMNWFGPILYSLYSFRGFPIFLDLPDLQFQTDTNSRFLIVNIVCRFRIWPDQGPLRFVVEVSETWVKYQFSVTS